MRAGTLMILLPLVACGHKDGVAPPTSTATGGGGDGAAPAGDPPVAWVDAGGGLELRLDLPAGAQPRAGAVTATLRFRNRGDAPVRIYLLGPEVFRSGQSDLLVRAGAPVVSMQPEPQPHGYLPTEADFPLIAPGAEVTRTQTLQLGTWVPADAAELDVTWTYQNSIESWPGGAQTLDGPTKPLFGGGPIPHIWRGKVSASGRVALQKME